MKRFLIITVIIITAISIISCDFSHLTLQIATVISSRSNYEPTVSCIKTETTQYQSDIETADVSILGVYKLAFDVAYMQNAINKYFKNPTIIANPDIFNELTKYEKTEIIKYIENKTGCKFLFKTREECINEGYGNVDETKGGMFGYFSEKHCFELSLKGNQTDQNVYYFSIQTYLGPLAIAQCGFEAKLIDNKWQIDNDIPVGVS